MKENLKKSPCISFTKASVMLGLSAMLCMPVSGYAESVTTNATLAQAAQTNRTVKGTVIDEMKMPMIGVTVRVVGTKTATVTDFDGNFTIKAKATDKLELSYIGYQPLTVSASQTTLSLNMKPEANALDEVVVIGYGTVRKRDLTGAVSQVKAADIKQQPSINAMEGLSGKISGLDIVRESGQAGTKPTILLRGNRSINADCSPLYVIDGVTGGSIDNINPNDIESIEVLKDASSTAIYGSAGANGVIIVTTKKGVEGKVQVDFDAYVGVNAFPSYPSTLTGNEWISFLKEGYRARYGEEELALLTGADGVFDMNTLFNAAGLTAGALEAYEAGKWIDWKDELLHTGVQQNYNVSVRGGNEKQQSYMSAGYMQEKGLYKNDQVDLLTFRAGTTYKINDFVSVGFQSTLTYRDQERRNSRLSKTLNQIPLGDVYDEDGKILHYPISDMKNYVNILIDDDMNTYQNNTKSTSINVTPFVELRPFKGLTFKSMLNASLSNSRQGVWDGLNTYMEVTGSQTPNTRMATYKTSNYRSYMWQNVLNYNFKIKDHDITLTGITEYAKNHNEGANITAQDFKYDNFLWYNMNAGGTPTYGSDYSETAKMSYAARVNYNYLGRYLLSASIRWDGASQLYEKWCSFPAFAFGWRVSDEPFMESTRGWLDNLKLRVGYGVTGNANIKPYVSLTAVTNSDSYISLGNSYTQGYILAQNVANYDLTWEKSYNWNFGLDFAVLNGRIDGSIEYYMTDTKGVLYDRPLPTALGVYNAKNTYYKMSNIARIKNKGLEVTINSRNIEKKNFKWNSTFTFATNDEQLKEINLGNSVTVDNLIALNLFLNNPVQTFYGYKKDGLWQLGQENMAACFGAEPGDVRLDIPGLEYDANYTYEVVTQEEDAEGNLVDKVTPYKGAYYKPSEDTYDENGNLVRKYYTKNEQYVVSTNDKQILGSKVPDWTIGLQNTFQIYDFDLSIMATMRWGQMCNGEMLSYISNTNIPDSYDYWTPENPVNTYPRPHWGHSMTTAQKEAMRFVDGSYFKISNITLGYTLPKNIREKLNVSKLRFYATITNPFIWAKDEMLKGLDPSNNASDKFPLYKSLVFGVNLSF